MQNAKHLVVFSWS